jgi:hypothetical protein
MPLSVNFRCLESKKNGLKWPVPLVPRISVVSPESHEADAKAQAHNAAAERKSAADVTSANHVGTTKHTQSGLSNDAHEMEMARESQRLASSVTAVYNKMGGVSAVVPRNTKEVNGARETATMNLESQRVQRIRGNQNEPSTGHTGKILKDTRLVVGGLASYKDAHDSDSILPKLHLSHGRVAAVQAHIAEDTGITPEGTIPAAPRAKFQDPDYTAEQPPPSAPLPAATLVATAGASKQTPQKRARTKQRSLDVIKDEPEPTSEADVADGAVSPVGPEDLSILPYVFEKTKAADAEALLAENDGLGKTGKFLVRMKVSKELVQTALILSVVYKKRATHHQVCIVPL